MEMGWDGIDIPDTKEHIAGVGDGVRKLQRQWWAERLLDKSNGPIYLSYKKKWGAEEYLNGKGSKRGRIWKTRMRACAVPLRAELVKEEGRETIRSHLA